MNKLFPSQQPQEKIYIAVREHWFRLFLKFFAVFLLSLLPIVFSAVFDISDFLPYEGATAIGAAISQIYYLGLIIGGFIIWVLYYLNLHIVSEMRIVDIDQHGLLKHEVSELNVETIEDVTSETIGLFGNFFNYGTVYVQTAGTVERFEFQNVPEPAKIANVILTLYERQRSNITKPAKP